MSEPRHDIDCPDCGSHYSVTDEAFEFAGWLADYAQMRPDADGAVGIDVSAVQWLQDVGRVSPESYMAIVNNLDRKTVERFLSVDIRDRRGRQAWRRIAVALEVTAPFDITSPEETP